VKDELKRLNEILQDFILRHGLNSLPVCLTYSQIGRVYQQALDYHKALEYYDKSEKILHELFETNPNNTKLIDHYITLLSNFGESYMTLGEYDKAKFYLLSSIRISEAINDIYAEDYNTLATCYLYMQEPHKALEYLHKDLQRIKQRPFNVDTLLTNYTNQTSCYIHMGETQKALGFYDSLEKLLPQSSHYQRYFIYQNLLFLVLMNQNNGGDYIIKAFEHAKEAFKIYRKQIQNSFEILDSTTKQDAFNHSIHIELVFGRIMTSVWRTQLFDAEMQRIQQEAFNDWINYKGEISSLKSVLSIIQNTTTDSEILMLLEEFQHIKRELSNEYKKFDKNHKIDQLEKRIDEIESHLSQISSIFQEFKELQNITYQDIASYLKPRQLYIDFAYVMGVYFVFSIDHTGYVKLKHILNSELMNEGITQFRANIKNNKDFFRRSADILFSIVSKNETQLIISPDGLLSFIPFEALYDGTTYLIESKTVSYVSSAKEFIKEHRRKAQKNTEGDIVIFANPNFDMKFRDGSRGVPPLLNQSFGALEWTQKEADIIEAYYPNAKIYTQENATVENLMSVQNPKILHIATHGFYLDDKSIGNSLEKSGLALSGASQAKKVGDARGIVTALSLSTLNLAHTDLVVLSACETGLGDVHNFDSVSSLANAFIQAGSKNVIMSLWKIDDEATSQLIQSFYAMIAQGKNYKDALREAKLTMLEQDPFYWSALTLHGV